VYDVLHQIVVDWLRCFFFFYNDVLRYCHCFLLYVPITPAVGTIFVRTAYQPNTHAFFVQEILALQTLHQSGFVLQHVVTNGAFCFFIEHLALLLRNKMGVRLLRPFVLELKTEVKIQHLVVFNDEFVLENPDEYVKDVLAGEALFLAPSDKIRAVAEHALADLNPVAVRVVKITQRKIVAICVRFAVDYCIVSLLQL
jgi:hypothetical protein